MAKLYTVEAAVHKECGEAYRVKVSIISLGVYINGMMVYRPNEVHNDWTVLTPARPAGRGKYARIVEFNKKEPLWGQVYEACVDAVKLWISQQPKDVVLDDIPDTISYDTLDYTG